MKTLFTFLLLFILSIGWISAQPSMQNSLTDKPIQIPDGNTSLKPGLTSGVDYDTRGNNSSNYDKIVIFSEDFTGIEPGEIPVGWMRTHVNWAVSNTNFANGEVPEMMFFYDPSSIDIFKLTTPVIDASGLSNISLSFNQLINHFSGTYSLKIQTSPDGATWTTRWEHIAKSDETATKERGEKNPDATKEEIFVDLSMLDGQTYYLAFVFDGNSYNINDWRIDDILVSGIYTPQINVDPGSFLVTLKPGNSSSRNLSIQNSGEAGSILDVKLVIAGESASVLYVNAILNGDSDFKTAMQSLSNIYLFDEFNANTGTPELDLMLNYDIVLVSSDYSFYDPVLLGNRLAQYVDEGGMLCIMQATLSSGPWALAGNIITPAYLPLTVTNYSIANTAISSFADHPITDGLVSINTFLYSHSGVQGEGVSLGNYDTGYPFAAYNPNKAVVALNILPKNDFWGGDLMQLMENTINWLLEESGEDIWLSVDINEAFIDADESQNIIITFDATDLSEGVYESSIFILSNDPANPLIAVPATMAVVQTYTLTLLVNPEDAGIVEGAGEYAEGEVVNISATAHEGFTFVNWTDQENNHVTDESSFQHTMATTDVILHANFDVIGATEDIELTDVKIFPNPANNNVFIRSGDMILDVWISDVTGKQVYSEVINNTEAKVSVENLQSGIYIVGIYTQQGITVKKLQIVR
ncbi:MAG: T9SS type A sorting domain-containing protein [Bacteroidales bacterium]